MTATLFWTGDGFADTGNIAPDDRGFTLGDGVFETMLWTGDAVRFFDDHMARLRTSANVFGLPIPALPDQISAGIGEMATALSGGQGAIRLTLSRGLGPRGLLPPLSAVPTLILSCAAFVPSSMPVTLVSVSITRNPTAPSSRYKTLSYIDNVMALREAKAKGGDDALMTAPSGNLACASAANIIVRHRDVTLTPPIEDGAMAGIVRGRLLRAGLVEEASISPDMLRDCTHVALTNALIGVRGVRAIDGVSREVSGAWLEQLHQALV
jgi:branched-chain amino acid aminotransferase